MAHQSLYRRYRPRRFSELRGQDHVVRVLRNAVREDRVGHAYLFSGPRGTGKTSAARILAKVLNCERPVDGEPCCECASCLAVEAGTSFDVHELDAASNNGVDDIRELIERASLGMAGRRKVYILDEVHMLSRAAESALLKTLEEPPPHVVFVLATTDPQKVSATIRSRTQHLEFHLLPTDELEAHVRWVAEDAGLSVTDEGIEAVLHLAAGSARDALSALDQIAAAGGVAPELMPLDELVEGLIEADTGRTLAALASALQSGRDARSLTEDLIGHLRDSFLAMVAPELVQLPDRRRDIVQDQGRRLGLPATVRAMEVLGEMVVELRHAPDPRVLLDVAMVRLTRSDADASADALLARIEKLERAVAAGGAHQATSPPDTGGGQTTSTGARARLGSAIAAAPDPPVTAAPAAAAPARPARPAPSAAPEAPPRPGVAPGEGPTRDELTIAWADEIVPKLSRPARSVLAAGRWIATADGTVLAVPNEPHRVRSEQHRRELETTLAAHFGRSVPVAFVVEPELPSRDRRSGAVAPAPSSGATRRSAPPPDDQDEAIDPAELIDAGPEHDLAPIERLTQAFPGAELIDEG
jgi:DNA polymerase-3 subunit gamma/tau